MRLGSIIFVLAMVFAEAGCVSKASKSDTETAAAPMEVDKPATIFSEPTYTLESNLPFLRTTKLWTIQSMPDPRKVTCIFVQNVQSHISGEESQGLKISDSDVLAVLSSAEPVPPDSERIRGWHYALGPIAYFRYQDRSWELRLFPGGLGFLNDDEGRSGAFLFTLGRD